MSAKQVTRFFRPQSLAAILGMGMLAVAAVGFAVTSFGGSLPLFGEIASAAVGMIGGAKAVFASA